MPYRKKEDMLLKENIQPGDNLVDVPTQNRAHLQLSENTDIINSGITNIIDNLGVPENTLRDNPHYTSHYYIADNMRIKKAIRVLDKAIYSTYIMSVTVAPTGLPKIPPKYVRQITVTIPNQDNNIIPPEPPDDWLTIGRAGEVVGQKFSNGMIRPNKLKVSVLLKTSGSPGTIKAIAVDPFSGGLTETASQSYNYPQDGITYSDFVFEGIQNFSDSMAIYFIADSGSATDYWMIGLLPLVVDLSPSVNPGGNVVTCINIGGVPSGPFVEDTTRDLSFRLSAITEEPVKDKSVPVIEVSTISPNPFAFDIISYPENSTIKALVGSDVETSNPDLLEVSTSFTSLAVSSVPVRTNLFSPPADKSSMFYGYAGNAMFLVSSNKQYRGIVLKSLDQGQWLDDTCKTKPPCKTIFAIRWSNWNSVSHSETTGEISGFTTGLEENIKDNKWGYTPVGWNGDGRIPISSYTTPENMIYIVDKSDVSSNNYQYRIWGIDGTEGNKLTVTLPSKTLFYNGVGFDTFLNNPSLPFGRRNQTAFVCQEPTTKKPLFIYAIVNTKNNIEYKYRTYAPRGALNTYCWGNTAYDLPFNFLGPVIGTPTALSLSNTDTPTLITYMYEASSSNSTLGNNSCKIGYVLGKSVNGATVWQHSSTTDLELYLGVQGDYNYSLKRKAVTLQLGTGEPRTYFIRERSVGSDLYSSSELRYIPVSLK